ncbi:MAG: glycosyltransferase family 4 protein [Anaerolineales bacterium]
MTTPARVLLITDIFPPDIGGPATFIEQLARRLAQAGHQVSVVCTSAQANEPGDAGQPYRVRRLLRRPPSLAQRLGVRAALAAEVLRHSHVFTNGLEYPTYQVCGLLRRAYVLKVVGDSAWESARNDGLTTLSIDDFQQQPPQNNAVQNLIRKRVRFALGARQIITPSHYLRRLVLGWGVPPERVRTIYNGVPLADYAAAKPRPRTAPGLQAVYAGRLASWKGVDTLLRALAGLSQVRALILGDGPEEVALKRLAAELGLGPAVVFAGRQPQAHMRQQLQQADVLVLDSEYEGLSHTLLEAGALGLPCIASYRGGNPEVIQPGSNGLLVPYGDVGALRAALAQLQTDEPLRYRLACQAKTLSERFDFEKTLAGTVEVLLGG